MTETKLCPLKAMNTKNLEDRLITLSAECKKVADFIVQCDGPRCAWWSAERSCCGVAEGR